MGLLNAIDRSIRASTDPAFDDKFYDGSYSSNWGDIGVEASDSGIPINEHSAMRLSTVWKCVDWYFRMFGHLPKRLKENSEMFGRPASINAVDHHLYDIVHTAPNPKMSSALFFGLAAQDMKTAGKFYAYIQRFANGRPQYLFRIAPSFCHVEDRKLSDGTKQRWYIVTGDNGQEVKFYPDEILHVRGMGDDLDGYSPIKMQMQLLGWNRATARYSGQFFKNASRPSGLVELTNPVKPEAKDKILESLRASGKEAGKLVLIEGAVKFHKMSLDADEAQFILTYQQQEEDIAGIFGVSPHEIGINRNINNSITEQQTINSVTRHLAPFCVLFEQAMNQQLLSDVPSSGRGGGTERARYFFFTELKGLLRGDTAAQTAHLIAASDHGWYSINETREYLGQSPVEDGDIRVINAAYVPLDMLRELALKKTESPAPGAPNAPGGPVPTENKASIFTMFGPSMRDAVGRCVSRKKDREKSVASIFRPIIAGIAAQLVQIEPEYIESYLGSMATRCSAWTEAQADGIAEEELKRAVAWLMEQGPQREALASPEPKPPETHNHVTVNVAQPAVSITNEGAKIETPKVDVHVSPANVTVKPPDVTVTVEAPKPTTKTVKRNKAGQITEITEE